MNTTSLIPASQNKTGLGFWDWMDEHAEAAWPLAMTAIADATGQPLESVQVFLDSRHGAYFADEINYQMDDGLPLADAITAATRQWMIWDVDKKMSKDHGIPNNTPYLTSCVLSANMSENN